MLLKAHQIWTTPWTQPMAQKASRPKPNESPSCSPAISNSLGGPRNKQKTVPTHNGQKTLLDSTSKCNYNKK